MDLERLDGPDERESDRVETLAKTEGLDLLHAGVSGAEHWQGLLANIHFNLHPGEMCAVIGPAGSGKDDLVGLLLGVRSLSSGQMRLGGNEGLKVGSVGYVAAGYPLEPGLTVRETLQFAAQLRLPHLDDTGRTIRLVNVCQELGIDSVMGIQVGKLRAGFDRMVVLAMEMLTDPEVVIIDEPFHGVDPEVEGDLMMRFERVADRGCSVLVCTNPSDAVRRCDALMVLFRGVIAFFGPPEEAMEHFGVVTHREIFQKLLGGSPDLWHQKCRTGMWNSQFLHRDKPNRNPPGHEHIISGRLDAENWAPMPVVDQVVGLLRRSSTQWRTRWHQLPLLAGGALFSGLAIGALLSGSTKNAAIACLAFALGGGLAAPEIVRERSVLERERFFSLSIPGYAFAKGLVVTLIAALAALFLGIGAEITGGMGPGLFLRIPAALAAASVGSAAGLFASSLAQRDRQALSLLGVLIAGQAVVALLLRDSGWVSWIPAGGALRALNATLDSLRLGQGVTGLVTSAIWFALLFGATVLALQKRRPVGQGG